MVSVKQVIEEIKAFESNLELVETPLEELSFLDDGKIGIPDAEEGLYIHSEALTQLGQLLKVPGGKFLASSPVRLRNVVADYYKDMLVSAGECLKLKKLGTGFDNDLLGAWVNKTENRLVSFTRSDIIHVDQSELVEGIADIFTEDECVYNYSLNEFELDIQCSKPDDTHEMMVNDFVSTGVAWNISKLDSSAKGKSLVYRLVCSNGLVVPERCGVRSMLSEGNSTADYTYKFCDSTRKLLERSRIRVDKFREGLYEEVSSVADILRQLKVEYRFSDDMLELIEYFIDPELGSNMYAVINAITAAANNADSYKDRSYLQNMAGMLLMEDTERCPVCYSRMHLLHDA